MSGNERRRLAACGVMLGALAGGAAHANPVEELKDIATETAILNAKARREEARARLARSVAEQKGAAAEPRTGANANANAGAAQPAGAGAARGAYEPKAGDPTVNWIEGIGRNVAAQIQMPDGARVEVRAGDVLSGTALKVLSISNGEVVVQRGQGPRVRLARTPQPTATAAAGGAAPALPPLPPSLLARP